MSPANNHDDRLVIADNLRSLGVRSSGPLLVHSSVRNLGPLTHGLPGIIEGLLESVNGGTLLLPALSYNLINWNRPRFDARTTRSCIGTLPEFFRTQPGTLRSTHITHSVCGTGLKAGDYLNEHHLDTTPCGPHSPFRKLAEADGQILMLGCGLKPDTSMHGVEELAEAPYLFRPGTFAYKARDLKGKRYKLATRRHHFDAIAQRYDRVADILQPIHALHVGRVKNAECHLIEAAPLWDLCSKRIREQPRCFVEPIV